MPKPFIRNAQRSYVERVALGSVYAGLKDLDVDRKSSIEKSEARIET